MQASIVNVIEVVHTSMVVVPCPRSNHHACCQACDSHIAVGLASSSSRVEMCAGTYPLQAADFVLVLQSSLDMETTKTVLQSAQSTTIEVINSFSQSEEHCRQVHLAF